MWLACHRGLVGQLVLGPVYLWVHRWVWEAVKIGGTDPLQIFHFSFLQQKNDSLTTVAVLCNIAFG